MSRPSTNKRAQAQSDLFCRGPSRQSGSSRGCRQAITDHGGPNPGCVPTTDDLDAALAAAAAGPQPVPVAEVDQLMDIPEPVDALISGPMELLDGHEWEFANGARVMFVPSDIAEGVANIEVRSLRVWCQHPTSTPDTASPKTRHARPSC